MNKKTGKKYKELFDSAIFRILHMANPRNVYGPRAVAEMLFGKHVFLI